jgi:hypothetical protein
MEINYLFVIILIIFILSIYLLIKYLKNKYIVIGILVLFLFLIFAILSPAMHLLLIQPSKYELQQGTNHISINLIKGLYRIKIYEDNQFYENSSAYFHASGFVKSDIEKKFDLPSDKEGRLINFLEFEVDKIFKRVQIDFLLNYEADMTNKMYLLCQPRK